MFLGAEAVGHDVRYEVEVEIQAVGEGAEAAGDEDAGEEDADGAEGEAVVDRVDEREDLEEGVVDAVDEGGVEVHKRDGWVLDRDLNGFDKGGYDHSGGFDVLLVDFGLRAQSVVAGEGAEAFGAAEEDVRGGGLGD